MKNNNPSEPLAVIILAAGLGKRMKSSLPKVLIEAAGTPMVNYTIDAGISLNPAHVIVVTGYQHELVEAHISSNYHDLVAAKRLVFAVQAEQRGTGDAVRAALSALGDFKGSVLILCGDTPLITAETLKSLLLIHHQASATISLIAVETKEPAQYGRIIRGANKQVLMIKEFKDCNDQERQIGEINSGVYVVDSSFLPGAIKKLENNNAQSEFYLTDIVAQAAGEGQTVAALNHYGLTELQGINSRLELVEATRLLRQRRIQQLIESGVDIDDPATVEVSTASDIAAGVKIGSHCKILGKTKIAASCILEGFSVLSDCTIGANSIVHQFVHADKALIGEGCSVGPFARIREGTVLSGNNRIGNFVETKKALLDSGVKANHLSYLGDCSIGENSNIGAGTITCNYDGYKKSKTKIGKNVFVGSNSALIAPVEISDGATIAAGSTITKNVEADALALTRTEQKSISGWSSKKKVTS